MFGFPPFYLLIFLCCLATILVDHILHFSIHVALHELCDVYSDVAVNNFWCLFAYLCVFRPVVVVQVSGETMSAVLLLPTHACANRVHGHVTLPLYLQPLTSLYSLYFSASLGRPPRCLSRSNNCLDCRLSMSSAVFVAPLFSPLHSLAQTFNCEYFSAGQECTLTYFFLPSASGKS